MDFTEILKEQYQITASREDVVAAFHEVAAARPTLLKKIAFMDTFQENIDQDPVDAFMGVAHEVIEAAEYCQSLKVYELTKHLQEQNRQDIDRLFPENERLLASIKSFTATWMEATNLSMKNPEAVDMFMGSALVYRIPTIAHYIIKRIQH